MTNSSCPANKLPEPGLSGTWVTRGSDLLGVIVAVYENEPYAHMLPIHRVFSDIRSLFAQDGKFPEVGICLQSSLIGRKSADMMSIPYDPNCERARELLVAQQVIPRSKHLPRGSISYFPRSSIIRVLEEFPVQDVFTCLSTPRRSPRPR